MKMRIAWVAAMVLLIVVGARLHQISNAFGSIERSLLAYGEAVTLLRMGSDDLTQRARRYVETGDVAFMDSYFRQANVLKMREQALDCLYDTSDSVGAKGRLENALSQSMDLMGIECHAMKLAAISWGTPTNLVASEVRACRLTPEEESMPSAGPDSKRERAVSMLYDAAYAESKDRICGAADCLLVDMLASLRARRESLQRSYTIWFCGQLAVLLFATLVSLPYVFGWKKKGKAAGPTAS